MSDDFVGEALDKPEGFDNFAVDKALLTIAEKKQLEDATIDLIRQLDGDDLPSLVLYSH